MRDAEFEKFFKSFDVRLRKLRKQRGWTQEDMLDYGFATRHYQRIEQGLQISMTTALRLAKAFGIKLSILIKGID